MEAVSPVLNKTIRYLKYFTPEGKPGWKCKEVLLLFDSGLRMNVITYRMIPRHLGHCFQI